MKNGIIIVVSGPSGVGKNEIIDKFINNKDLNLAQSISMTSRERRAEERDGITYDFVTREYFEKAIANNSFAEYTEFLGNYYGTPLVSIDRLSKLGKNILVEVEASGAKMIKLKYPNVLTIFVVPSSLEKLEAQIRERRNEDENVVMERLNKAKKELNEIGTYKYVVNNDEPELAGEICSLIIKRHI